jgi:large conductance mechanosensitive channel
MLRGEPAVPGVSHPRVPAAARTDGMIGGRPARAAAEAYVDGFKKFLLRGNVVDLAVAVVIGAAFSAIVNAFVKAFIAPLVGLALGAAGDFSARTFTVSKTEFPYGQFVQAVISFLIIAAVVYFLVVLPVNRLMERFKTEPEVVAETKQCPECLSSIPIPASRCAFCTVEQLDVPAP